MAPGFPLGTAFGEEWDLQVVPYISSIPRGTESVPAPCQHHLFLAFPDIFPSLHMGWASSLHPSARPGVDGKQD